MFRKHEKEGKGFNAQNCQDTMIIATEKGNVTIEFYTPVCHKRGALTEMSGRS